VAVAIIAASSRSPRFNVMPILVSSILGCIALVTSRCLTLEEAYGAIDWKVIFLLAGVLPWGWRWRNPARRNCWRNPPSPGRWAGPVAVLAVLYLLTAVLTEFMSNGATAVLMSPVALSTAAALEVDAKPLLMAVCFAASANFATPSATRRT